MILTKTPLRITLGGGGTDLPSYYRDHGGFVLSAAIDKYVYIGLHRSFAPGYLLKYSESEYAPTREQIRHRLIREALIFLDVEPQVEIVSLADVPAGTGLGSSGSFLVGLLHALYAWQGKSPTPATLAAQAATIEIDRLNDSVGKQDQYIAAYGGLLCQEYAPDGNVHLAALEISQRSVTALQDSLMLFFVGQTRSASTLLNDQKRKSEHRDPKMLDDLNFTKQLGFEIKRVLEQGHVLEFGKLMHQHWLRKRERSAGITNQHIDRAYAHALQSRGAIGGKLVGAGGGGFLLLQTEDRARMAAAMAEIGMKEMEFRFEFTGSMVRLRE
jgi:D-glycero-alpha-D-manno-heptose-7-phosphate kinase